MKRKILLVSLYAQNFQIQLALYYLKAYLNKYILKPSLIDVQIKIFSLEQDKDTVLKEILKTNPDIIGFSCYVWNITEILNVSSLIKRQRPKIKIVLGGPEVSPRAGQLLKNHNSIDFVVMGEGEERFKTLIEYLVLRSNALNQIDGLAYRDNGRIVINKETKDLPSLDIIPSPYLEGLIDIKSGQEYPIETMRGCAYRCHYCYYHKEFKNIRCFSLERVEKELKYILKDNPRSVYLMDPTFNVNRKRAKNILKIFIKYNKKSNLHVELKAELLDNELVELLHKARTNFIEIGIQSTNKKTLKLINRDFNTRLFEKNIRLLNRKNVPYEIQLIDSLPQDNYKTMLNSIDWLLRLHPASIRIMRLMLLPGTMLRELANRFKIKYDRNPPYCTYRSNTYSADDVEKTERLRFALDTLYHQGLFRDSLYNITKDLKINSSQVFQGWLSYSEKRNLTLESMTDISKDRTMVLLRLGKISNYGLGLAQYLYKKYNHGKISSHILNIVQRDRDVFLKHSGLKVKTKVI